MPVKLKKRNCNSLDIREKFTVTIEKNKTKKTPYVFKTGYHFNDLFTIKHNYASINKMKLRTRKKKNP